MSSSDSSNTYDELPYSNFPFPASHPNRLVTRAAMAGLKAPAAATCRLLDVGCGRGGNLIPMGLELPDAEFVGIDLSRRQVEEGQRVIETLGLANLRIEQADLCDPPTDLGDFDFVIAHGVYSWMPKVARDALLDLIRQRLRRRGVAYVSYNVLPGWRLRTISRELMLYHTRNLTAPLDRVKQGRRILSFMAEQVPDSLPEYREVIASDSRIIENAPGGDSYAYHEFLEEENSPLYFWQFVEHAAEHGLAYLTESDPRDSGDRGGAASVSRLSPQQCLSRNTPLPPGRGVGPGRGGRSTHQVSAHGLRPRPPEAALARRRRGGSIRGPARDAVHAVIGRWKGRLPEPHGRRSLADRVARARGANQ